MLDSVKTLYNEVSNSLHVKLGRRQALQQQGADLTEKVRTLTEDLETYAKASFFLQTLSDQTRQEIIDRISGIVTDALQKVKDPNLEFKMKLSIERNQMDVKFMVIDKKTGREDDILLSCGGTLADIISLTLKLALLVRWQPALSRVLILDESTKFVSRQDQPAVAEFIRQIAEKLDTQILLVTHSEAMSERASKAFQVTNTNGVSKVTTI